MSNQNPARPENGSSETKPLVSILIPCYNSAPWVAATLDSALAQTWSNKEIIVINDGSTDASREIVQRYVSRGVTIIDKPNGGQSAAFNSGLAVARGDYVEFLDSDDLLAPDKIERQIELARISDPDVMISGAWTRFSSDPLAETFTPNALWVDYLDPVSWLTTCWPNNLMMHGAAWLIPRRLVTRAGGWNEDLNLINDFEFFSRLMLHSSGVRYCPTARSYYRSGVPGSMSGYNLPRHWKSAFTAISLGTANLLKKQNDPVTRGACIAVFRQYYFDAYPRVPEIRAQAKARIVALGGKLGRPTGGPVFAALAKMIGWRGAKRLQFFGYRYGYKRFLARLKGR